MPQGFWDLFFGVVLVGVGVTVAFERGPDTAYAELAIVAIAGLYGLWGRRLVRAGRSAVWYAAAIVLAFAAGSYAVGTVNYVLFAVCPMMFLILELRQAIIAVVAANLVPILAGYVRGGQDHEFVTVYGPIFVMTTVVSAGFGLFINRIIGESQERAQLITELENSRAEVGRLSHEAGVAAERTRLAGEIHDTLAQGFTSIITLLQAADPKLADERLRLAVETAKENLAESRALVAALTPSALGTDSLPDALRRQVTRAATSGTPATATFRTTGEPRHLPTALEVVLLRTTQEALTNIRRHAEATEVTVVLAYAVGQVRLTVRDNGCGFTGGDSPGFGLNGMRSRAEQAGGTLSVRSAPGQGTTVELEVPA
ncbi:two-component sensor histidine kinase [Winogradskya humida]|uniref:Oxygen sensor histidine kinase NreB n=2 Tax=Winogradskya humida TaxID=113566 RepID=A0ABQ3ZTV5_9ACTN|nr:two-component sensor histidine kinase [Actinoplanes humidus]